MVTLVIPPNRNPVSSPAKDWLLEITSTPTASMPTNSSPIDVSSVRFVRRPTTVMPSTMTAALMSAPTVRLKPITVAMARPGTTPWAKASPRNVIPRRTTHVPTRPQAIAANVPAQRPRCIVTESRNGATTHSIGPTADRTVTDTTDSDLLPGARRSGHRRIERSGDPRGILPQHPDVGTGRRVRRAERLREQVHHVDRSPTSDASPSATRFGRLVSANTVVTSSWRIVSASVSRSRAFPSPSELSDGMTAPITSKSNRSAK